MRAASLLSSHTGLSSHLQHTPRLSAALPYRSRMCATLLAERPSQSPRLCAVSSGCAWM